jgi:hypothetical protein
MDFLFEFLFQILFEIVGEALIEWGFRGAASVLRSRIGRYSISIIAGFGFGAWWGSYLSDSGIGHQPRLLWISIAAGIAALIAAFIRAERAMSVREVRLSAVRAAIAPWDWPTHRLVAFGLMNLAIAAGIVVGFSPPLPG